jgi:hypothetical protein
MTQTVNQSFEDLLSKITVSKGHISQASASHNYVRDLLNNKWQTDNTFPWLIDGDFLSGSYARGTKIYPLDDVDIMVILDGQGLFPLNNGFRINASVRGGGQQGSPIHSLTSQNGLISSVKVLEAFRSALAETYPNSIIKKDGQAVNVWLDSYNLGLDVVPCFNIVPNDGNKDYYYIPMGHGSDMWISTNPKIDESISNNLDKKHNGRLKPIIKLLKHWNQEYNAGRLRSYHMEATAWYIFHNRSTSIDGHSEGLHHFFSNATPYFQNNCNDPTGIGGHIDSYLAASDRNLTINAIQQSLNRINQARTSEFLGQHSSAIGHWRQVFGQTFGS